MDNTRQQLTREQEEYRSNQLEMAGAYEELVQLKGWEWIQVYYQAQVASFANDLLLSEATPIEQFAAKRHELIGLKKLLGHVQSALDDLARYRKEQGGQPQPDNA